MKRLLVAAALVGCGGGSRAPRSAVYLSTRGRGRKTELHLRAGAKTLLESLRRDGETEIASRAPSAPPSLARVTAPPPPPSLPAPERVSDSPEAYLRHKDPLVRWWAAEAAGLARRKDLVRELARMILRRDVAASMAAWALGMIAESSGVSALARGMFDERPGLRVSCASALCSIEGRRASKALASGLDSKDYRVRAISARELGRRRKGLRRLSFLYRDPHEPPAVRVEAAAPLAAVGDGNAFRYLERLSSHRAAASRTVALKALGETSLAEAVVPVAAGLDAREVEVWQQAAVSLTRLPREDVTRVLRALEGGGSLRASAVLGAMGVERAFERLRHCYQHGDGAMRRLVCAALASCRDARAVHLLESASRAERLSVRLAGIRALGLRGDPRGFEPLLQAASDADPRVRMEAARSLGGVQHERARNALEALAKDPSRGVKREALLALSRRAAADRRRWPPTSR